MITFKSKSSLPLSKDEISRYIFLEVTKGQNTREYQKFSERCRKVYGSPKSLVKIGKGVLSSWGRGKNINIFNLSEGEKTWKEGMDYVYSKLISFPKGYFQEALGVGSFGIVFPAGPGRIEKINYKPFLPQETKFYGYLLKHPLPVFPKVYSLGKDRVVMEKIDTGTPRIKLLREYIEKYVSKITTNLLPIYKPKWKEIKRDFPENHWFPEFLEKAEDGLEKIYGYKTLGDLSPLNVGQRGRTEELVYFDPVGGDIIIK